MDSRAPHRDTSGDLKREAVHSSLQSQTNPVVGSHTPCRVVAQTSVTAQLIQTPRCIGIGIRMAPSCPTLASLYFPPTESVTGWQTQEELLSSANFLEDRDLKVWFRDEQEV